MGLGDLHLEGGAGPFIARRVSTMPGGGSTVALRPGTAPAPAAWRSDPAPPWRRAPATSCCSTLRTGGSSPPETNRTWLCWTGPWRRGRSRSRGRCPAGSKGGFAPSPAFTAQLCGRPPPPLPPRRSRASRRTAFMSGCRPRLAVVIHRMVWTRSGALSSQRGVELEPDDSAEGGPERGEAPRLAVDVHLRLGHQAHRLRLMLRKSMCRTALRRRSAW